MRTFPKQDEQSELVAGFEIENAYASPATCARILEGIDGVTDVRKRRPFTAFDEIHVRFNFEGAKCVVWEPFGDNSRYWIGQEKSATDTIDLRVVERAFQAYEPPLLRRLVGDIVTLNLIRRLLGRGNDQAGRSNASQ